MSRWKRRYKETRQQKVNVTRQNENRDNERRKRGDYDKSSRKKMGKKRDED